MRCAPCLQSLAVQVVRVLEFVLVCYNKCHFHRLHLCSGCLSPIFFAAGLSDRTTHGTLNTRERRNGHRPILSAQRQNSGPAYVGVIAVIPIVPEQTYTGVNRVAVNLQQKKMGDKQPNTKCSRWKWHLLYKTSTNSEHALLEQRATASKVHSACGLSAITLPSRPAQVGLLPSTTAAIAANAPPHTRCPYSCKALQVRGTTRCSCQKRAQNVPNAPLQVQIRVKHPIFEATSALHANGANFGTSRAGSP